MLQPDRIVYYFSLTHELPEVEFKGSGKRGENPLFGRVVRAAMAMANRRNGGTLIIGVAEKPMGLSFDGLTPEQLATWKYEYIASGFNSYTNVPIEFERMEYEHDGNTFLILDIHEFATVPIMCIKEYRDNTNPKIPDDQRKVVLLPGAFYIRTLNNAESKEMLTSEEIRSLFDLVSDKAVRSFVTHTKLAGINIIPQPEDKELFAQQLKDWTGLILEEIRTRGYWDIHIRPVNFHQERVPLSQLHALIASTSVNYRGGEFPYTTSRPPEIGHDWIGLEMEQSWALQAWRFFQSGHFAVEMGFLEDWRDKQYAFQDKPLDQLLSIQEVIFRLTEVYGLASRLATTDIYRDERSVVINVTICNVQHRRLYGQRIYQTPLGGYTAGG